MDSVLAIGGLRATLDLRQILGCEPARSRQ